MFGLINKKRKFEESEYELECDEINSYGRNNKNKKNKPEEKKPVKKIQKIDQGGKASEKPNEKPDEKKNPDKDGEKKKVLPKPNKIITITFNEIDIPPGMIDEDVVTEPAPYVCKNPFCDHQDGKEVLHTTFPMINRIDDLISLGKTFHCKKNKKCNDIDLEKLYALIAPLEKLKKLVGMKSVKEAIVNQIVYFLQGLQTDQNDMLHTVIEGPPGVGKTELGKILGEVYVKIGILKSGVFNIVKRSDLIAGFLGQTAMKTQKAIDSCKGGVMFIDEAYALGNSELRDSFSKECIDTLNQNLTENKGGFLCIIAGYADALDHCFFAYNDGLRRRFSFRYTIDKYTAEELRDIFLLKVEEINWGVDLDDAKEIKDASFFKERYSAFPCFGGDIETYLLNCKIYHGKRVFLLDKSKKKILTKVDIVEGYKLYAINRSLDKLEAKKNQLSHLYL